MTSSDKIYSVYVHINNINGKAYVGATHKNPPYKRWGSTGIGYKRNKRFYEDILNYGWNNYSHIILASDLTEPEASELERHFIEQYDSANPERGYNFEHGGLNKSENDRCKKISESLKGENHHQYHKPVPAETREKIRNAMLGEKGFWYGQSLPDYIKQKLSIKSKENNNAQYLRASIESQKVKVKCVETNKTYNSIKEAAIDTGANRVSISRVLNGKQEAANKLHWIKA